MITPDLYFSYWVFAWFLVYFFMKDHTKIHIANPTFALYISFLENVISLFVILYYKHWAIAAEFFVMLCLFKGVPIYLLRNEHTIRLTDIYVSIGLFAIYCGYLFLRKTSLYDVYQKTMVSLIKGTNETPFFYILHRLHIQK
jgi:hypothetical protein